MQIDMSPATYLLLCGLVKDALAVETDATPLLKRAAQELAQVATSNTLPLELLKHQAQIAALARAGSSQ